MDILLGVAVLVVSLLALIKTSHWVIGSAMKIAHMARLSEMTVGFLFIAVATSLPELAVSVSAIMSNDIGISIGNLLGSNIADIALIVGIAALFGPVIIKRKMLKDISAILFLTSFVLILLMGMTFASRYIGILLLFIFAGFVYFSLKNRKPPALRGTKGKTMNAREVMKTLLTFAVGVAGVFISSRFVVDSAVSIALALGVAESVIGASVIAVGTSLPELAVDLTAIRAKRWGLALGDAIGSTLTNITLILGFVLAVSPFAVNMSIFQTITLFVLLTNVILWYFISRGKLERSNGIVLLFIYLMFLMSLFGVQLAIL
jgi:cation:H+ antiporter